MSVSFTIPVQTPRKRAEVAWLEDSGRCELGGVYARLLCAPYQSFLPKWRLARLFPFPFFFYTPSRSLLLSFSSFYTLAVRSPPFARVPPVFSFALSFPPLSTLHLYRPCRTLARFVLLPRQVVPRRRSEAPIRTRTDSRSVSSPREVDPLEAQVWERRPCPTRLVVSEASGLAPSSLVWLSKARPNVSPYTAFSGKCVGSWKLTFGVFFEADAIDKWFEDLQNYEATLGK